MSYPPTDEQQQAIDIAAIHALQEEPTTSLTGAARDVYLAAKRRVADWDPTPPVMKCECGRVANAPVQVWNGKHHLDVCEDCWISPDTIATEALVRLAEDEADPDRMVDYVRAECEARDMPVFRELVEFVRARWEEWY